MADAADAFLDAPDQAAADSFLDSEPSVLGVPVGKPADALQTMKDLGTVVGPAEAVGNVATGTVFGFPLYLGGGIGTLAARAAGATDRDPQEVAEELAGMLTYRPRTEAGKRLSGMAAAPSVAGRTAGEYVAKKSGSATLAALVDALFGGSPMLLGLLGRGGGPAARPKAPRASEAPSRPAAPPSERPFPVAAADAFLDAPARSGPTVEERPEPPLPTESPFPAEAGNLDDVLPKAPAKPPAGVSSYPDPETMMDPSAAADVFLDAPAKREFPTSGVERITAVADAVSRGEEVPPEVLRDFPALAELVRVRKAMAAAELEKKRAREAQAAAVDKGTLEQADPAALAQDPRWDALTVGQRRKLLARVGSAAPSGKKWEALPLAVRAALAPELDALESQSAAVRAAASERARSRMRTIDPSKDDLPTILGKAGGISHQALVDLGLDPADIDRRKGYFRSANPFAPAVKKSGGLSLDGAAELLDGYGFDVRDEYGNIDATKVASLIDDHMSGSRVFAPEGYETQAALEAQARAELEQPEVDEEGRTDQQARDEFGPGTLGANRFLDPKLLMETGRAAVDAIKEGGQEVMLAAFGQPGQYRDLFNPIRDAEQTGVARIERWATGESHDLRKAFPSKAEREDLTRRLGTGNLEGLTPEKRIAAERLQSNYRTMGQYAMAAERLDGLRQNYSPQIWDVRDKTTRDILDTWRAARGEGSVDPSALERLAKDARIDPAKLSPFMLSRSIPDLETGLRLGLKPASLDAAELFETYARSMASAVERGKTLDALANLRDPDGNPMVVDRKAAPADFQRVNNPELEGLRVHPDVAPAVRVLLETNDPGVIARVWQTLAYTSKRALVSYSFFHPKALLEVYAGTGGNPLTAKGAIDAALKKYRDGGVGDEIDQGLAAGLRIGAPLEDVLGRDRFLRILEWPSSTAERMGAPRLGKLLRVPLELDRKLQALTWDYLQTGLKLDTFLRKFEDEKMRNAKAIAEGKITEHEIARQAAEFSNAAYGGINWERMLDGFDTPMARRVMSEVLSKSGRSAMQSVLFAPDWMVSSLGSWTNSLGMSERNAVRRRLAQRYLVTSAAIIMALGNSLNYYFTGHSMFANRSSKKDATLSDEIKAKMEVQLGDGRRIQIAKHFFEAPHAVVDPLQYFYNKLNPTVSTPIEIAADRQWLSTGWAPPIYPKKAPLHVKAEKSAEHALSKFLPITAGQLMDQGLSGVGGFFGFPVYGMTEEERAANREKRHKGGS